MASPETFRIVSLGCKVNQYEGQCLAERLEAAGLRRAVEGEVADICLTNGCAVTAPAARKSLDAARLLMRGSPGARLVVAGCLVSHLGREEALRRSGADLALNQEEKLAWPEVTAETQRARSERGEDGSGVATMSLRNETSSLFSASSLRSLRLRGESSRSTEGITRFDGHSRAFLKVQDGCAAGCTYCVVPALRGRPRSRPLAAVAAEAARLAADGRREIVLCGTHLGWYGRDLDGRLELADAVEATLSAAPGARVRVSSLEAGELSPRLVALAGGEPRVCPHFHLPLQSGDDGVLRAMNRRCRAEEFLAAVEQLRGRLDLPAVSTDVMVGFPGEDAAAFDRTLEVCRRAGLSRLHVFRYSPRRGTPAAGLPGRVPVDEAGRRADEARALGRELAAAFASACVGRVEEVLAENATLAGLPAGYTGRYVRTGFRLPPGAERRLRELHRVRIERARGADLIGSVTEAGSETL